MDHFTIGNKVSLLHETGQGIIRQIAGDRVLVEDEMGFENWYAKNEIVPIMSVSDDDLFSQTDILLKKSEQALSKSKAEFKNDAEWTIDLHMENLTESHNGMSNYEILQIQLAHFNRFLKKAEEAKIGRLIVVHGRGTGKLKSEIKLIVNALKGTEIYDADLSRGASIIERKYNWR